MGGEEEEGERRTREAGRGEDEERRSEGRGETKGETKRVNTRTRRGEKKRRTTRGGQEDEDWRTRNRKAGAKGGRCPRRPRTTTMGRACVVIRRFCFTEGRVVSLNLGKPIIYIHVYIGACIYVYSHIYMCIYIHIHIYIYVCMHSCVYVCYRANMQQLYQQHTIQNCD